MKTVAHQVLFLLLVVSGCTSAGGITVYPRGDLDAGVKFSSNEEYQKWVVEQGLAARNLAESLPVDYRLIILAVVAEMITPTDTPQTDNLQPYLSVFNEDPDDALSSQLTKAGFVVYPKSKYPGSAIEVDGQLVTPNVGLNFSISINWVRSIDETTYIVEAGYYCGVLCAGQIDYTVSTSGEIYEVVNADQLWIS
jgi:hypothetical protein